MLFTSRNKAAQGLRLKVSKHDVGCLGDEESRKVLLAGSVQLDDAQLQVALDFCSGLPLALTLLNGALAAEDDPACLIHHLETHGSFSVDQEDELVSALSYSVQLLSDKLQTAWLDLAWMYGHERFPILLLLLQCLFGEHTLQKLVDRSLVAVREVAWPMLGKAGLPMVEVVVHDVLLRIAEHMYGPQGKHHYLTFNKTPSISLSQAMKVGSCRCVAMSCHVWRQVSDALVHCYIQHAAVHLQFVALAMHAC